MKRIVLATILWASLGLVATPVYAQQFVCSNGNLANYSPYSLMWQGNTIQNGVQVPWVGTGTAYFYAGGVITTSYTTSVNGVIYTDQTTSGQFKVNRNCTGTITFTSGDAAGLTATFVVTFEGEYVIGTDTDPGDTMNFTLESAFNLEEEVVDATAAHRNLRKR